MSPEPEDSSPSPPAALPDGLGDRLAGSSDSELRAAIAYAKSLLPSTPTVEELLEERPDEEILEVDERDSYTRVVKRQPCATGCDECPHGPYAYHVRVEKRPEETGEPYTLHWEFVGPVK